MEEEVSFQDEIEWCVGQLVLGLLSGNPNSEQVKDSKKVIDKLQGNKVSYVSKRHLMNVVFGDYRKRMRDTPLARVRQELSAHNLERVRDSYKITLNK
jgi:hypothetical protein